MFHLVPQGFLAQISHIASRFIHPVFDSLTESRNDFNDPDGSLKSIVLLAQMLLLFVLEVDEGTCHGAVTLSCHCHGCLVNIVLIYILQLLWQLFLNHEEDVS